jgi:hypothetical protein
MRRLLTLAAILFMIGCEEIVDMSGAWKGETTLVVDGEEKTVPLEVTITQSEKEITGSICWGEEDQPITYTELDRNEVFLKCEWDQGVYRLRGLVVGEVYNGRFTYTYVNDPEPFPAKFEVRRQ